MHTMNLDEAQRQKVREWIAQGLKLSEIQGRLATELQASLTYMEVRFLVDDLKLVPKDPEPPKASQPAAGSPIVGADAAPKAPEAATAAKATDKVSLTVDRLTRPGALVSGKVTFTDGITADWYMDQTGRLGIAAKQQGYRPPAADVQQFQVALEAELAKLGF